MVNIYIVFQIGLLLHTQDAYFMLGNSLFGVVKLTKIDDPDEYSYSGYGIQFDACRVLLSDGSAFGKKVIIFGADMCSSVHIDNKKKDILILVKSPRDGSDDATLTPEKEYYKNLTQLQKKC